MRKTGRAAALILACFVCLLPVFSFQASAATLTPVVDTAEFYVSFYHITGTRDLEYGTFEFPMSISSQVDVFTEFDYFAYAIPYVDGLFFEAGEYQIHVYMVINFGTSLNSSLQYVEVMDPFVMTSSTGYPVEVKEREHNISPNAYGVEYESTIAFTIPEHEANVYFRLKFPRFVSTEIFRNNSFDIVLATFEVNGAVYDPSIDPSDEDREQIKDQEDQIADKNNQSQGVLDKIETLEKPTVGTGSGGGSGGSGGSSQAPVIGGMTVNPMSPVDQESFASYTNVIGAIFGSGHILSMFIISFGMIFISYVLFGKTG